MSVALPIIRDNRRRDIAAAAGQIAFTFDAPLADPLDLVVALRISPSTAFVPLLVGYTVTLLPGNIGATVTFTAAPRPTAGDPVTTVRLTGSRIHARTTDVTRGGALRSTALEGELDRQAMVLQELRRDVDEASGSRDTAVAAAASAAQDAAAAEAALTAIQGSSVADGAVSTSKLADAAVTTAKLSDSSVTPAKLALGAWTTVASAATVNLGALASRNIVLTGTTAITSFGATAVSDGVPFLVRFAASLTLTNGANLILPGAANIQTAAGDVATVVADSTGVWRVIDYQRADGNPLNVGTGTGQLIRYAAPNKYPAGDGSLLTGVVAGSEWSSALQSITSGATTVLTHNLGGKPRNIQLFAVCQTADLGYAVGDEILVTGKSMGGANYFAEVYNLTTTTLTVLMSSGVALSLLNKSGGAYGWATLANWKWYVRAIY